MVWSYLPFYFSIMFFLISLYINSLVQIWTDQNFSSWIPALPDIGHRLLPYWTYFPVNNYYLLAAVVLVIIRYIFQRDVRIVVFRRWLFLQAIMFIMRSISMCVTSLSVPIPGCNTTATGSPPIEAFYIMFYIHTTCGDVFFSGHTVTLTLCALAWTTYSKGEEYYPILWLRNRGRSGYQTISDWEPGWFYPKLDSAGYPLSLYMTTFFVWTFTIIGYLLIIATRFHYTVEVFLGFLLSQLTWQTYHYYIKTLGERRNIIITRFFRWFEGYGRLSAHASASLRSGLSTTTEAQFESLHNSTTVLLLSGDAS